jgi:PST family polysaccharide transporter
MSSYRQIFKSTAIVGGAKVITLAVGLAQNKVLAVLLGREGMGVAGQLQSIMDVVGNAAGFGLGSAGVRQIAEAAANHNEQKLAATARTLRLAVIVTGLLGLVVMLIFRNPLALQNFNSLQDHLGIDYGQCVAVASLALFCITVSNGQAALLQGLRRLKDLASCQVAGSLFGATASILLVYFLGIHGVAWYLVATNAFLVVVFWWRARQVKLAPATFSWPAFGANLRGLLGIGFAFMLVGVIANGTVNLSLGLVRHDLGAAAVGVYYAVTSLSTRYVNVVFQAMGADFYPRLTGVANDHPTANRLINEQTEIGVLIALPGVLATMALAPWLLRLLATAEFMEGASTLRWLSMGVVCRMITWPMGFILMAKGMTVAFVAVELLAGMLQLGLLAICLKWWGLEGAGVAFLATNAVMMGVVAVIIWRISGFQWSPQCTGLILGAAAALALVEVCLRWLPGWAGILTALAITGAVGLGCLALLQHILNLDLRPAAIWQRLRNRGQSAPPAAP